MHELRSNRDVGLRGSKMSESLPCRIQITFRKEEPVQYISHLDLLRAWERIVRRAEIRKKTLDLFVGSRVRYLTPGDDLLSHGICHTTIGAEQFHF